MPLRDSVEAVLEAELRGLVAPVVLHLRSVWRPVGVVDDERVGAALSLRLLSTSSIVGLPGVDKIRDNAPPADVIVLFTNLIPLIKQRPVCLKRWKASDDNTGGL